MQLKLAKSLFRAGKIHESAARCEAALRLKPDFATAHHDLGLIRLRQGRLDEAAARFEEAARHAPSDPLNPSDLGYVRLLQGRLDWALRIQPDYPLARHNFELVRRLLGRTAPDPATPAGRPPGGT